MFNNTTKVLLKDLIEELEIGNNKVSQLFCYQEGKKKTVIIQMEEVAGCGSNDK